MEPKCLKLKSLKLLVEYTLIFITIINTVNSTPSYNATTGKEICNTTDMNSLTCYNNGRCEEQANGTYMCICQQGYTGLLCNDSPDCQIETDNVMVLNQLDVYSYNTEISYTCRYVNHLIIFYRHYC